MQQEALTEQPFSQGCVWWEEPQDQGSQCPTPTPITATPVPWEGRLQYFPLQEEMTHTQDLGGACRLL